MFSNIFFLSCLHKNVKKIFLSYYCLSNQQLDILLLVISFRSAAISSFYSFSSMKTLLPSATCSRCRVESAILQRCRGRHLVLSESAKCSKLLIHKVRSSSSGTLGPARIEDDREVLTVCDHHLLHGQVVAYLFLCAIYESSYQFPLQSSMRNR
jgi:hypothetical protein